MKKYILLILICGVLFTACDERLNDPAVSLNQAPQITTPTGGTEFVLDAANAADMVSSFEWTAADFGYQAAVTYSLTIDAVGNDFSTEVALGTTSGLSLDNITTEQINNVLFFALGLPDGFPNPVEIRVCATVSDLVSEMCSDPVPLTLTLYKSDVEFPKLNVPGDYQGWDPADPTNVIFSRKFDERYEGYVWFGVEEAIYKFAKGSWDENWGDEDPADGTLEAQGIGNDIPIMEGMGLYQLTADLNILTHTATKTEWGVIGSATPSTSDDTDMTWDDGKRTMTVTMDLSVGNIRFRANDADDINFGDDFANGSLEADGADIEITEAGNYTIDLILTEQEYTYVLTKN